MPSAFPNGATVEMIRVARPTQQLEAVVAFYRDGLGLPVIGEFRAHAGYDGVMLGLPGRDLHLEFTRDGHGTPGEAPTRDNLLVLYLPDETALERFRLSLTALGHAPVTPENPYWQGKSLTFEDPDGWRVVLLDQSKRE